MSVPKYYISESDISFTVGFCKEVASTTQKAAAIAEACRLFDDEGIDARRPVDVVVAADPDGRLATRYTIRQHIHIEHEVVRASEAEVLPADDCDPDGSGNATLSTSTEDEAT